MLGFDTRRPGPGRENWWSYLDGSTARSKHRGTAAIVGDSVGVGVELEHTGTESLWISGQ